MKYFEVRRAINAPADRIWAILTDKAALLAGDFAILKIEGDIGAGGKVKLWSEADPKRAFPLKVAVFEAPREMLWTGGMPFGLFKGERRFRLTPNQGGTDFHMREEFTGPMARLITKSMPDLQPLFDRFGDALKTKAEEQV